MSQKPFTQQWGMLGKFNPEYIGYVRPLVLFELSSSLMKLLMRTRRQGSWKEKTRRS